MENDSLNKSNTQQKTTTNEVKNQILYEFKQPVQESKEINMTTLETNVVFHDGLVMYKLKKRGRLERNHTTTKNNWKFLFKS